MTSRLPHSAFTFIELMIVVTIIVIMAGGALVAYFNFNKTETMNSDARNAAAEISKARSMAASLQYPTGCTTLSGYRVTGSGSQLTTNALCASGSIPVGTNVEVLLSSVFTTPIDITFAAGSGYLTTGQNYTVTIKNTQDNTTTKNIVINSLGIIQ